MLRFRFAFLSLLVVAAAADGKPKSGEPQFGTARYVEYVAGDLPIVLTAPHGGRLKPDAIPARTKGVSGEDLNTQALARAVAAEFVARTGQHVHLVASLLHRSRLDPNREIVEAAQGNPIAGRAWNEFHAFVRTALAAAVERHGFAFLVDLHGHGHLVQRLELGYILHARQLNQSDASLDASGLVEVSTLGDLHRRVGGSAATLLRGPRSLGGLFTARGFRAIPSPKEPQPGDAPYFTGGYIVHHHTATPGTAHVDGVQIECPHLGVRQTVGDRARFARITAEVLTAFVEEHYPFKFPVRP